MTDLRELIYNKLKTVHARVYFMTAPKDTTFPYLVYNIPNIYDDGEGFQRVMLDIDGWDDSDDTTALETLMKSLNTALNKATLANDNITVTLFLDSKLSIEDEDPNIKRRRYTYEGKLFLIGDE